MTAFGSYVFNQIPPIPLKFIPDLRIALLLASSLILGVAMSWGPGARRGFALYGVLGYVLAFHLEEATIHWIGPMPGSLTGTRIGLIGTAGSLLAVLAVLLMHVDVESARLRKDLLARGAPDDSVDDMVARVAADGRRRILGLAAGVAGLGAFLAIVQKPLGDSATGGGYILILGGALLLALGVWLLKLTPKRDS
ncbi:MAG TPA: hypothetical protein VHH36_03330 [Candidatus Thermoplasmatota archaeon]|nr:hypothetical protein [Candidatus Thermoplasmatota archaeon]